MNIQKDFMDTYMHLLPNYCSEQLTPVKYSMHKEVATVMGATLHLIMLKMEHERSRPDGGLKIESDQP
jgi:hypothetical protein